MYKTILVHIDETARSAGRTEAAARLALEYGAHLVGTALTGLQSYLMPVGDYEIGFEAAGLPVEALRKTARAALERFEQAAGAAGVTSVESRCIDDEAGLGMSLQARYADLVVISQTDPDEFLPRLRSDFPDYVVLNAPRPVLVLPLGGAGPTLGRRVTVAWDGSAEAVRAIAGALPLLQRAERVDLVVFDADIGGAPHGEEPGADMALYLARQGVRTELCTEIAGLEPALSLLGFARQRHADLIVMGAYGHSRFREILLGGMTRDLLAATTIPLWMSH